MAWRDGTAGMGADSFCRPIQRKNKATGLQWLLMAKRNSFSFRGKPLALTDDFRADPAIGENFQEERMGLATVDEVDLSHTGVQGVHRAVNFGEHPA